jgi:RluA family pseudouridine synthase
MKLPPIVFEDESLIAFDKPSGLLIAPDRWDKNRENLMDLIHEKSPETFNVHRLDSETSGVLLCAKTKSALDKVSRQFEDQKVEKRYLAIVAGSPVDDETVVRRAIAEDYHVPGRMRLSSQYGKPSETTIKVITRWRGYALVEAFPKTGRTHQIRVHLVSIGCPVLADSLYGSAEGLLLSSIKRAYKHKGKDEERPLIGRLALHAQSLELTHPTTGEPLKIESPIPHDFEVSIKYLKRFAGL